jgi:hypothetical protein
MTAIERLSTDPENKTLLLAILAERFPEQRAEYLTAARHFNIQRKPPYLLVRRATDGPEPSEPRHDPE